MVGPGTEAVAFAIATAGVSSAHELPRDPLTPTECADLVRCCGRQGTLGLLAGVVRRGGLELERESRGVLERQLREQYRHDLRVEQTLLRIVDLLDRDGIDLRVLGPVALARTVYAEAELRGLDDVHVLVAASDVERATARVGDLAREGCEVLVSALPFPAAEVMVPAYRFPLAGYELQALAMPQRLLQLCAYEVPGRGERQIHLRDIAEVVLRERPNLVDLLLLARAWDCEAEVAESITTTWATLAVADRPPLVEWADRTTSGA